MSLAEMAAKAAGTGGRLVCPKCGCADFRTYGKAPGHELTLRYKQCRHCGYKMITKQAPEQFVREVDSSHSDPEPDEIEGDIL